jgi:hypothetical protein
LSSNFLKRAIKEDLMKTKYWGFILVAMLCGGAFFVFTPVWAVDMKEGMWEHTMEVKMEGVPGVPPMPFTTTQCMTKEDLVPKSSENEGNCKVIEQKITGNKVVWKVRCLEKDSTVESEGEITYNGTTYSGSQKTKITEKGGQTMTSTAKMKGRRIGDCK